MKKIFGNKLINIIIIFIVIFIIVTLVIIKIGGAYKSGLLSIFPDKNSSELTSTKISKVKKITLKDNLQNCIEVTSDGAVRVYKDCGKELTTAGRVADQTNILKLIKLLSQKDLSQYLTRKSNTDYELTVETDDQTITIYLPNDPGSPGQEIIDIIKDIENNLNSPSPFASSITVPNPSGYTYPSIVPSSGIFGSPYPSPTDQTTVAKPFVCDFTESGGGKKPVNVSNIICTSDQSPAPL